MPDILLFGTLDYLLFAFLLNPIPTRLYHMIYYHGDEKYSYLVRIWLNDTIHSAVEVIHLYGCNSSENAISRKSLYKASYSRSQKRCPLTDIGKSQTASKIV